MHIACGQYTNSLAGLSLSIYICMYIIYIHISIYIYHIKLLIFYFVSSYSIIRLYLVFHLSLTLSFIFSLNMANLRL